MDEREHRGFRITRRTVLESGTVTAAFMLGGFPRIALAAEASDAETAISPINVELQVNGVLHRLTLDPRTTLLDALREHLAHDGIQEGLRSWPVWRMHGVAGRPPHQLLPDARRNA